MQIEDFKRDNYYSVQARLNGRKIDQYPIASLP